MSLSKFVTNAALMATMPLLLSAGMLYRSGSCIRQGDQIFLKLEKSDLSPLFVLGGLGAGAIAGYQFWTMAREEEGQGAINASPLPGIPNLPPLPAPSTHSSMNETQQLALQVTVPYSAEPTKLIELSKRHGWVTASKAKASIWAFKQLSVNEIRDLFEEYHSSGLGFLRGDGDALEWRFDRVTD